MLRTAWQVEVETAEDREAARRADLEAAYRREHAGYIQQGKTERAAAVEAAARSELGIDLAAEAASTTKRPGKPGGKR